MGSHWKHDTYSGTGLYVNFILTHTTSSNFIGSNLSMIQMPVVVGIETNLSFSADLF